MRRGLVGGLGLALLGGGARALAAPAAEGVPVPPGGDVAGYLGLFGRFLAGFRPDPALEAMERVALAASNRARQSEGLERLAPDPEMAAIARFYADQLARGARFAHEDAAGRGPGERVAALHRRLLGLVAENLFGASHLDRDDPDGMGEMAVDYLLRSPGHRRNLLDVRWTHAGMGAATGPRGPVLVQLFLEKAGLLLSPLPANLPLGMAPPAAAQQMVPGGADGVALVPAGRDPAADDFATPGSLRPPRSTGLHRFFIARATERTARTAIYSIYPGPLLSVGGDDAAAAG